MNSRFPMPRVLAASIALCLGAASTVAGDAFAAPALKPAAGAAVPAGVQRYIVRFAEPALASVNRSLATPGAKRLGAVAIPMTTRSNGRLHLDAQSAPAQAYLGTLANAQAQHQRAIASALGRPVQALRTYRHALNAAVMQLTAAEADKVARLDGIASISPDRARKLADDVSTRYIGADAVWLGSSARATLPGYTFPTLDSLFGELNSNFGGFKGDGIVVGDIDTGYNSLSPSFQATDASGYTVTNPLGSGNFIGHCSTAGISLAGCNDKVIGVYDEVSTLYYNQVPSSVEDTQGHGSHTASTIAGNAREAGFPGFSANIAGIAPHANLVIYYACAPDPVQCQDSATAGAVDQAIQDGIVDVLNFSISGGSRPWNDPVSLAFLSAEDAGIFVAAAAGNTGTDVPVPLPGTVNHLEPWVATVAATTEPAGVAGLSLSLTGPGTPPASTTDATLTEGTFDTALTAALPATTPIVLSPQFKATDTSGTDGCNAAGGYPTGTFANSIALISRGTCAFAEKVPNAIAAGAIAVVIADNRVEGPFSPTVGPPQLSVPVFSISQTDALAIAGFLSAHAGKGTASMGYASSRKVQAGDVLADFSLLGPGDFDLIKPDVAGPGVAVLAAVANDGSSQGPDLVAFYDGTSMATPHITGTGALVLAAHPDWTPMEVKSAIMMTSVTQGVTKADGSTPADFYDVGSGRVQAYNATRAGLVLDETAANMSAAYPDTGGDPSTLNIASMQNSSCAVSCTFTRTFTATQAGSWAVSVAGELAGKVTVTPASFSLAKGATVALKVTVDTRSLEANTGLHTATVNIGTVTDVFGAVTQATGYHLPLSVGVQPASIVVAANSVDVPLTNGKGSGSLVLSNPGAGTMGFAPTTTGTQTFTWIDQPSGNYYGEPSVHYTIGAGAGDLDYYSADDFTITGSSPVNFSRIFTPGFSANHTLASFGASLGLHWRVYTDADGVPGSDPVSNLPAPVWSYDGTAGSPGVSVAGDAISLDLVAANLSTALPAGHYWLVVFPDMPCNDPDGQSGCTEGWYWLNSWKNTGDIWAITAPGTDWYSGVQNLPYGAGMAMTLTSQVGCSLPDWLSLSPANGTVAAASSTTVTFNADFSASSPPPPQTTYACLATSLLDPIQGASLPRSVIPVQVNAH